MVYNGAVPMTAYTVQEIDALRRVCGDRFVYGTFRPKDTAGRMSMPYIANEKVIAVEEMVRTYMAAGVTAEDILKADGA